MLHYASLCLQNFSKRLDSEVRFMIPMLHVYTVQFNTNKADEMKYKVK